MYVMCVQLFTVVELVVLKLYVPPCYMYMLRKSMSERKMRFFGHIVRKNGMEKRLMQRKMEGKRRRGRPATTWFKDLKEWTKLDIAGASQLVTDRERWRKIIEVTAAQIAPPD